MLLTENRGHCISVPNVPMRQDQQESKRSGTLHRSLVLQRTAANARLPRRASVERASELNMVALLAEIGKVLRTNTLPYNEKKGPTVGAAAIILLLPAACWPVRTVC